MELNANEIIKALKYCTDGGRCLDCQYDKGNSFTKEGCMASHMRYALALITSQEQKIFDLENRLKECENGYEGTLHLESCKLHDAEEKVKELTQAHDMLSESYDHLEKTKDNLLAERARLTEENERLRELATVKEVEKEIVRKETRADTVRKMQERLKEKIHKSVYQYWNEGGGGYYLAEDVDGDIDQIAKEMLEGE